MAGISVHVLYKEVRQFIAALQCHRLSELTTNRANRLQWSLTHNVTDSLSSEEQDVLSTEFNLTMQQVYRN